MRQRKRNGAGGLSLKYPRIDVKTWARVAARRCRENCDVARPPPIFIRRRVACVSIGGELVRLLAGSECPFWGISAAGAKRGPGQMPSRTRIYVSFARAWGGFRGSPAPLLRTSQAFRRAIAAANFRSSRKIKGLAAAIPLTLLDETSAGRSNTRPLRRPGSSVGRAAD